MLMINFIPEFRYFKPGEPGNVFLEGIIKDTHYGQTDLHDRKIYTNDILRFSNGSVGVFLFVDGKISVGSVCGEENGIPDYNAIDDTDDRELKTTEIVGNIYQNMDLLGVE